MYKKFRLYHLCFLFTFLLFLPNSKIAAQLDLNLTEEKSKSNQGVVSKDDYLEYIRNSVVNGLASNFSSHMILGDKLWIDMTKIKEDSFGQRKVKTSMILEAFYKVKIFDECNVRGLSHREMIDSDVPRIIGNLNEYYIREKNYPNAVESQKERIDSAIEQLKNDITLYRERCVKVDNLANINKYIDDMNNVISSAHKGKELAEIKKEEARTQEIENERLNAQKEIKAKIDPIINYANTNRVKLESESKTFCKDVSGVWYTEGDYFTIDLFSEEKIIILDNNRPLHVQIGKYDKNIDKLVIYVTKDGNISPGNDGKLFGFVISKIKTGGREFKLGISMTDGIDVAQETILGWVRELQ